MWIVYAIDDKNDTCDEKKKTRQTKTKEQLKTKQKSKLKVWLKVE